MGMKPRTRDLLVYLITSIVILTGIAGLMQSLSSSRDVPDPETEGFSEFLQFHYIAYGWLIVATFGAVLLALYVTAKETPMWKMRQMRKSMPRRSAAIIAIGLGITLLGLGAAAIMYHQAYTAPENVVDYQEHFDRWNEQAKVRVIIGLIGGGILAFGALFNKVPDLEFEESLVYRRPLWHGLAVMALGIAIGAAFWYYGAVSYDEYLDRDVESDLQIIMMFGLGAAFFVFVFGLFMWARNAPLVSFRYQLQSGERDKEHK